MFVLTEISAVILLCLCAILLDGIDDDVKKDSKLLSFIKDIIRQEGIELLNIIDLRDDA